MTKVTPAKNSNSKNLFTITVTFTWGQNEEQMLHKIPPCMIQEKVHKIDNKLFLANFTYRYYVLMPKVYS